MTLVKNAQKIATITTSIRDVASDTPLNDELDMLRLIEKHSGFAQWRFILPDRVVWSRAVAEMLGGNEGAGESDLRTAVFSYLPEDRAMVVRMITQAIEEQAGFRFVGRVTRPDGSIRTLENIGDVRMQGGVVTEVFGALRDISDEVRREGMALGRARLIADLVRELPSPVVVLDRQSRILSCNRPWARSIGLTHRRRALGQPLVGLAPGLAAELAKPIRGALEHGRAAHMQLAYYDPSSRQKPAVRCTVVPWFGSEEKAAGVVVVLGSADFVFAPQAAFVATGSIGNSFLDTLARLKTN